MLYPNISSGVLLEPMNEDVIADFKQFIATTTAQQTSDLSARLDKIETTMATNTDLEDTKNEILGAIGETLATNTDATDATLANHEQRLVNLEVKAV